MRRLFRFVILLGFVGAIVTALRKRISPDRAHPAAPDVTAAAGAPAEQKAPPETTASATPSRESQGAEKVELLEPVPSPEELAAPHGDAEPPASPA